MTRSLESNKVVQTTPEEKIRKDKNAELAAIAIVGMPMILFLSDMLSHGLCLFGCIVSLVAGLMVGVKNRAILAMAFFVLWAFVFFGVAANGMNL